MMESVALRSAKLKKGSRVITMTRPVEKAPHLTLVSSERHKYGKGTTLVHIYEVN